jgi:hypothetical protein
VRCVAAFSRNTKAVRRRSAPQAITGALSKATAEGKGPPPVERWNPPFCGDLDMRIATDGTWFYLKRPIGRLALLNSLRR